MKAIKTHHAVKCSGKHFLAGMVLIVGKGKDLNLKDAKYLVDAGAAEEAIEPSKDENKMTIEQMADLEDLKVLNVKDLKAVCKYLGVVGYSDKKEDALIEMIDSFRSDVNLDDMSEEELRTLAAEEGVIIPEGSDIEAIRTLLETELSE